jgi:hypothetical protein
MYAWIRFASCRITLKKIGEPVWQRNYYEHIIRDVCEWENIQTNITGNPLRWEEEGDFPMQMRLQNR